MASVQELIAASQVEKSPFIQLLEGFGQGAQRSQVSALDNLTKIAALQQAQQKAALQERQAEQQAKNDQIINRVLKQSLGEVGGPGQPVTPGQKQASVTSPRSPGFDASVSFDSTGKRSINLSPRNDKLSSEKYVDSQGQTRIGRWDPQRGLIQGPNDPIAPQGVPDKSMQREITKAKVSLAKTRPMVQSVVSEIDRVQKLNKNSFGGMGGAARMKFSSATGIGDESDKFKNTADVVNTMQSQVAKVLKSTFGGQLSDGERAYLNGVYGALPTLSRTERDIAMTNVKTMLNAKLEGDEGTLRELMDDAGIPYDYKVDNAKDSQASPTQGVQKSTPKTIGRFQVEVE